MGKECMTKERYEKIMKTYNLVTELVDKYGTEKSAKLLIDRGLIVTASELEVFKKK